MEKVSINDLYRSNGQINLFGWLFFIATLLALGFTAYQAFCNSKKLRAEETLLRSKITQLEQENTALKSDMIRIKQRLNIV